MYLIGGKKKTSNSDFFPLTELAVLDSPYVDGKLA